MHTTLVDPATLHAHLADPSWVVLDARFDLTAPAKGSGQYGEGHIPGARYVSLDRGPVGPEDRRTGRHPLPDPATAAATFGRAGHRPGHPGGRLRRRHRGLRRAGLVDAALARAQAVAVLDGGLAAWTRAGLPVSAEVERWAPAAFTPRVNATARVAAGEVLPHVEQPGHVLVDARAADRFRGQNETLDPVAGHIPGAVNRFFQANLTAEKTFKTPAALRDEWTAVIGGAKPGDVVMYCGSGVTACHNLLALEHAGLSGARLFPGSWSEWCADPSRPVATGD